METLVESVNIEIGGCTDPTYKEWKRGNKRTIAVGSASTDPTYKEWKPDFRRCYLYFSYRTDPTYKEWKLRIAIEMARENMARILPTRNGNRNWSNLAKLIARRARILPTRNGNKL